MMILSLSSIFPSKYQVHHLFYSVYVLYTCLTTQLANLHVMKWRMSWDVKLDTQQRCPAMTTSDLPDEEAWWNSYHNRRASMWVSIDASSYYSGHTQKPWLKNLSSYLSDKVSLLHYRTREGEKGVRAVQSGAGSLAFRGHSSSRGMPFKVQKSTWDSFCGVHVVRHQQAKMLTRGISA